MYVLLYYGHSSSRLNQSTIEFGENSTVLYSYNIGWYGGAVYSEWSILFKGNSRVTFAYNEASWNGGAVCAYKHLYCCDNAIVIFGDNSTVIFNYNTCGHNGGAVYSEYADLNFKANARVTFINSRTIFDGGAVYGAHADISFEGRSMVEFKSNTAHCNLSRNSGKQNLIQQNESLLKWSSMSRGSKYYS